MDEESKVLEREANDLARAAVAKMFECYGNAPLLSDWREMDRDASALLASLLATMDHATGLLISRYGSVKAGLLMDLAAAFYERVVVATNEAPEAKLQ
ncbi:MAG TPA: hypothetical protein DCL54_03330 [Alphaproteobacteria bacterium]|nr:hypothetical protein [Alphaproteobacteria bacterium]